MALLLAALSLAVYVPHKYATQSHTMQGFYALLFPLSGLLPAAGVLIAAAPHLAPQAGRVGSPTSGPWRCCGWPPVGILCLKSLTLSIIVFLSLLLIVFALQPCVSRAGSARRPPFQRPRDDPSTPPASLK